MKLRLFLLALIHFLAASAFSKEPKHAAQKDVAPPIPQMVVVRFTFKKTDFSVGRSGEGTRGIRDPRYCASNMGSWLSMGETITRQRAAPGDYREIGDDINLTLFTWDALCRPNRGDLAEVSVGVLKDLYGADAIMNVVEKPYEQVRREDAEKKRIFILDALKKSEGEPLQAAQRLKFDRKSSPLFLTDKNIGQEIRECQAHAAGR